MKRRPAGSLSQLQYAYELCGCMKDERNQVLIAYLWIRQKWNDAYLRWNKEDYDGLEVIHIPSSLVWRPDLVLYNKYAFTCLSLTNTQP